MLVETDAKYRHNAAGSIIGLESITRAITYRVSADHLNSQLGRIIEDTILEIYLFIPDIFNCILVNRGAAKTWVTAWMIYTQ